jgi:site-specific DNA recombinase
VTAARIERMYDARVPAGIYVRISDDRLGDEAGVSRQEEDCRRLAASSGWTVADVYRENDTSAFKRRKVALPDGTVALRVVRPEFRRLLDDLAAGKIGAVIGYDLDRVARDPRDLEDLIDVAETTHRPVRSVTGNLDLSHTGGITMARIAVAMANQSSRDTSRRVRRAKEAGAAEGRWGGGGKRPFGWSADRTTLVPGEAEVLRDVVDQLLAGASIVGVVTDLQQRDVPTVTGATWSSAALRRMVTRPGIAGLLEHRGKVVGRAPWPAVVDEATWRTLVAELESRPRNDTTLRWWLAGLACCARCGARMRGNQGAYVCFARQGGCGRMWVSAAAAEDTVARAVLKRLTLAPPPTLSRPAPPPDDSQLTELAEMWGRQEISLAEYRAARAAVVERLRTEDAPPPAQLPVWARAGDVPRQWLGFAPAQRQQVARGLLASVLVHPSPDRRFHEQRLELHWR